MGLAWRRRRRTSSGGHRRCWVRGPTERPHLDTTDGGDRAWSARARADRAGRPAAPAAGVGASVRGPPARDGRGPAVRRTARLPVPGHPRPGRDRAHQAGVRRRATPPGRRLRAGGRRPSDRAGDSRRRRHPDHRHGDRDGRGHGRGVGRARVRRTWPTTTRRSRSGCRGTSGPSWSRCGPTRPPYLLPTAARPRWVHHGSSISHGSNAAGPTSTWPAVASSVGEVDLVNLGFGGQRVCSTRSSHA